ncbi:MAG: transcriptional repressor NrdR [bacterium]|nr:MAG: transcriptional repressor NrdR [bacterium]
MKCPACHSIETKVTDSRISKEGENIRRRRECLKCRERFTTFERIEEFFPAVIKKDGRREEFNRNKIRRGLDKAFEKRPVSVEEKEALVNRLILSMRDIGEKEVSSAAVGQMILDELRGIDEVAYVRFASVYRSFRDISEFMDELTNLLKGRD